uniref:Fatty acyl-CoA reductase n=1 Tax=Timema poppense TaxID=170557 RepID=A0A7R9DDH0_TIMPO|nr:unnamed protein product [Timema poppensis]
MVPGDCALPKIGLSPSDYVMLTQQVNIILHLAATVRFDEKINIAVPMNIGGTKEIIDLCRACVNLKSIVYLSTAYSNCNRKYIEECFYDPPLEYDGVINILATVDEAVMEVIKPKGNTEHEALLMAAWRRMNIGSLSQDSVGLLLTSWNKQHERPLTTVWGRM